MSGKFQRLVFPALLLVMMAAALWPSAAYAGEEPQAGMTAHIQRLIADLSDVDFQVRQKATTTLTNLPIIAYPAVETVVNSRTDLDPETAARLRSIRDSMRSLSTLAKRLEDVKQWDKTQAIEAYNRCGLKDPRWDEMVIKAILLQIEAARSMQTPGSEVGKVFQAARAAGCADPLFLYYYARYCEMTRSLDGQEILALYRQSANESFRLKYPPERQALATARYVLFGAQNGTQITIYTMRAGMPANFPANMPAHLPTLLLQTFKAIGQDHPVPPSVVCDVADLCLAAVNTSNFQTLDSRPWVAAFQAVAPQSAYVLVFQGEAEVALSQPKGMSIPISINGQAPQPDRPEDHRRKALEFFEQAYQLDPQEPRIASEALAMRPSPEMNEQTMEKWFQRAMQANPDNRAACAAKINYFTRTGRDPQALEFARQCVAGGNWRGRLPLILPDVHTYLAGRTIDKAAYLAQPEVWNEIQNVYSGYLAVYPDDRLVRSAYALAATQSRQWQEAQQQFQLLGDNADVGIFGSPTSYRYLKRKADRLVARAATGPAKDQN